MVSGGLLMPEISLIVPVYNVEDYLKRCVDSILSQTYCEFELILVDDGSKDGSGSICDEYAKADHRIRVIHKENGGLSSARNAGIDASNGIYLFFVDSDDWLTEDALECVVSVMKKTNADIVSASYQLTDGTDRAEAQDNNCSIHIMDRNQALKYYMLSGMSQRIADFSVCAKLYKREMFDNVRFPEGQLYEDGATNLKIIMSVGKYVKCEKAIYYYFQGRNSIVNSKFRKKVHNDLMLVGKQYVELVKDEPDDIKLLAEQKRARAYLSSMIRIVFYGIDNTEANWKDTIKVIQSGLRRNYILLMKSPMPLNRKIPMTILAIDYRIPMLMMKCLRKVKGQH